MRSDVEMSLARLLGRCAGRDADQPCGMVGGMYWRFWEPKAIAVGIRLIRPLTDARENVLRYAFPALFTRAENGARLMAGEMVRLESEESDVLDLLRQEIETLAPELLLVEVGSDQQHSGSQPCQPPAVQGELFDADMDSRSP